MGFSQRLKELRTSFGLSQRELAQAIKLSPGMISMYEAGKKTPTIDVLSRLVDFFDVSADYLLGLTDDPTPKSGELPAFIKERLKKLENIEQKNYPQRLREIAEMLNRIADELEGKEENR
ncbi:MAG: XRE family transcriptional regulator [Thermotogae bacterium]|nr:MAG: XRE family transcriptional regulator [Thermotogota bacterium]